MKPKKHLGQHFLKDDNISRKIADMLPAESKDTIVEIGPGLGALTKFLIGKYKTFLAVEFDPEAIENLQRTFEKDQPQIIQKDILKWEPSAYLKEPAWFIGNLPYNISSPVFFMMMENIEWVRGCVFMIQKEVADRIVSPPGNKTYGILSVLLGYYFNLKYGFTVSENVFIPPPKVKSAVFTMMTKNQEGLIPPHLFAPLVKKAFNQRRKTLRNALKGLEFKAEAEGYLGLRAERLSPEDFERLFHLIVK